MPVEIIGNYFNGQGIDFGDVQKDKSEYLLKIERE